MQKCRRAGKSRPTAQPAYYDYKHIIGLTHKATLSCWHIITIVPKMSPTVYKFNSLASNNKSLYITVWMAVRRSWSKQMCWFVSSGGSRIWKRGQGYGAKGAEVERSRRDDRGGIGAEGMGCEENAPPIKIFDFGSQNGGFRSILDIVFFTVQLLV